MRVGAFILMCVVLCSLTAQAQITGVVSDQIAQRRVPGAVVTVLDSARRVIARGLADDSGRFRIQNTAGGRRIRIVKIGYRPLEAQIPALGRNDNFALERIPNLLEAVLTSDQPKCSRNSTRPAAFGLWEQARSALLGSVVARETNTGFVRRINFRRYMNSIGDVVVRQSVRRDSSFSLRSFNASFPTAEFLTRGFANQDGDRSIQFHGPDAEVLLDDAFVEGYCLQLAPARRDRIAQVGLRFTPMARVPGRVDLDGTLWIDTSARVLRDIEYTYLGLEPWATPFRPGGTIAFRETSASTLWIDRWWIRMMGAGIDRGMRDSVAAYLRQPQITEAGAELSSARWDSGDRWNASLGSAEIQLVRANGAAVAGARAQLDSTDYIGVTDATGRVTLDELLPGPYTISVYDSTLAVIDTTIPASHSFIAARDSTSRVRAVVPTLTQFVARGCRDHGSPQALESFVFIARIVSRDGWPVTGARWRLESSGKSDSNARDGVYAEDVTKNDGLVFVCERLSRYRRVVLKAWLPGVKAEPGNATEAAWVLVDPVTTLRLAVPP